jgi:WD40 repeat protein
VQHKVLTKNQLFMTANESSILCIDSSFNYYYRDKHFNNKKDESFDKIEQEAGNTVLDIEMNEQYIFILYSTNKLKIFDTEKLDLVKEIDITANQIKLVSTSHFVLFDSTSRLIQLYDQCANFELLHNVDLSATIDIGFRMAQDRTKHLTFFNHDVMKSTSSE